MSAFLPRGTIYFLLSLALLTGDGLAQAESPGPDIAPVNDAQIRSRFQKGLEKLEKAGTSAPTEVLLEQLKTRTTCDLALSSQKGSAAKLSPPEIYERGRKSTLVFGHIYKCDKCTKWHPSMAGAVVIDPTGIAVTNYHVMEKKEAAAFGGMDLEGNVFPVVEVLAASRKDDLAIVRLSGESFHAVPVSSGDPVGSEVKVISHPDGRFYTFSEGSIARYYFDPKTRTPRVQITADYARGSSGCGVFNESGELTGVVAATNSIYYSETKEEQRNLQMVVKSCIPAATIRKLMAKKGRSADQSE